MKKKMKMRGTTTAMMIGEAQQTTNRVPITLKKSVKISRKIELKKFAD